MTHHKMTNSITNKLIENSHKDGYFQKEIQDNSLQNHSYLWLLSIFVFHRSINSRLIHSQSPNWMQFNEVLYLAFCKILLVNGRCWFSMRNSISVITTVTDLDINCRKCRVNNLKKKSVYSNICEGKAKTEVCLAFLPLNLWNTDFFELSPWLLSWGQENIHLRLWLRKKENSYRSPPDVHFTIHCLHFENLVCVCVCTSRGVIWVIKSAS